MQAPSRVWRVEHTAHGPWQGAAWHGRRLIERRAGGGARRWHASPRVCVPSTVVCAHARVCGGRLVVREWLAQLEAQLMIHER